MLPHWYVPSSWLFEATKLLYSSIKRILQYEYINRKYKYGIQVSKEFLVCASTTKLVQYSTVYSISPLNTSTF